MCFYGCWSDGVKGKVTCTSGGRRLRRKSGKVGAISLIKWTWLITYAGDTEDDGIPDVEEDDVEVEEETREITFTFEAFEAVSVSWPLEVH